MIEVGIKIIGVAAIVGLIAYIIKKAIVNTPQEQAEALIKNAIIRINDFDLDFLEDCMYQLSLIIDEVNIDKYSTEIQMIKDRIIYLNNLKLKEK